MGTEYEGVGGIGIEITEQMIDVFISKGLFTREDYQDVGADCLNFLGLESKTAGNLWNGECLEYFIVPGNTLGEVKANIPGFLQALYYALGYKIEEDSLEVVADICIS